MAAKSFSIQPCKVGHYLAQDSYQVHRTIGAKDPPGIAALLDEHLDIGTPQQLRCLKAETLEWAINEGKISRKHDTIIQCAVEKVRFSKIIPASP